MNSLLGAFFNSELSVAKLRNYFDKFAKIRTKHLKPARNVDLKSNNHIAFDYLKFLLILGVVAIHSNTRIDIDASANTWGWGVVNFLSEKLTTICVPCFFILSGFLYFNNIERFSWTIYLNKTKRRIYTLLIPYLIWNIIALALCLLKYKFLDYPSFGVIEDGQINIWRLIEGFWDYSYGYPYAFAFWFIRNLIIFIIISPIAYFIGGINVLILATFIALLGAFDISLWQFEYFVLGCGLASFYKKRLFDVRKSIAIAALIIWICSATLNLWIDFGGFGHFIRIVCSICGFIALFYFCQNVLVKLNNSTLTFLASSTFFVYAVHQLFGTITRKFFVELFGIDTAISGICSFIFSFLTLIVISFIIWIIMQKTMPTITKILSGSR